MSFAGKTVLVTGAAKGIGLAVALHMARAGARVAMIDRDRDALDAAAAEVTNAGRREAALALAADVSSSREVSAAVAGRHRALRRHRRARQQRRHPFRARGRGLHRRGMGPDLRGQRERRVLHDSRGAAGAAPLARRHRQRLVDDGAGRPGSRRRLRGVERRAGVDDQGPGAGAGARRHPRQLRVPGRRRYAAAARRGRHTLPDPEAVLRGQADMHLLKRLATAEEIASAIAFLASPASSFITGTILPVEGGATLGYRRS